MKPIEEGCRAVIVGSAAGNDGIIVTIGKYIGHVNGWVEDNYWEIDKAINSKHGTKHDFCGEKKLRRIDDEDTTTWEHVAETIGFIPNKQTVEEK
jgi:hypothetical protein